MVAIFGRSFSLLEVIVNTAAGILFLVLFLVLRGVNADNVNLSKKIDTLAHDIGILRGKVQILKYEYNNRYKFPALEKPKPVIRRNKQLDQFMVNRLKSRDKTELIKLLNEGFKYEEVICCNGEFYRRETDKILYEKGYRWFVYIKLLYGRPFIVGKTGTCGSIDKNGKVKQSSVDFDFKIGDEDDYTRNTPGRNFVRANFPNLLETDSNRILCLKCNGEQQALNLEQYIAGTYNLYQS